MCQSLGTVLFMFKKNLFSSIEKAVWNELLPDCVLNQCKQKLHEPCLHSKELWATCMYLAYNSMTDTHTFWLNALQKHCKEWKKKNKICLK